MPVCLVRCEIDERRALNLELDALLFPYLMFSLVESTLSTPASSSSEADATAGVKCILHVAVNVP
jgi:hypothetical protein